MRPFTFTLLFALSLVLTLFSSTAEGAHFAYCTNRTDGKGDPDPQSTQDCCNQTKEKSSTGYFKPDKKCYDALGLGNGINLGRFVKCCGSRGAGNHLDK